MIRHTRRRAALALLAACTAVPAVLGLSATAASALVPMPFCDTSHNTSTLAQHCEYNSATPPVVPGAGGYYLADDNHTHYRYVQTTLTNLPDLVNLAGATLQGAVGVELCDPNIRWAIQIGLVGNVGAPGNTVQDRVYYSAGFWQPGASDPCVTGTTANTSGLLQPAPDSATNCPVGGNGANPNTAVSPNPFCGSFQPVGVGDVLGDLAIYYTPGGHHFHQFSVGYCDITASICRQAYIPHVVTLNLWEAGIGAFTQAQVLTAPANISLETFSADRVTCYSCAGPVPIGDVSPVNPFGVGGVTEAQYINGSSQVVLSPLNTLVTGGETFTLSEGSTS